MSRCLFSAGGIQCAGTAAKDEFCAEHREHRSIQHGKAAELAMGVLPIISTLLEVRKVLAFGQSNSATLDADITSLLEQAENVHAILLQCEEDDGNTDTIRGIEDRCLRIESEFIRLMAQLASLTGTAATPTLLPN